MIEPTTELVTGASVAVAAALYLFGKLRALFKNVEAISALLKGELTHNHGSSMKDDLHGIAVSVGVQGRQLDDLENRFTEAVKLAAKHHPEDAPRYLGWITRRN